MKPLILAAALALAGCSAESGSTSDAGPSVTLAECIAVCGSQGVQQWEAWMCECRYPTDAEKLAALHRECAAECGSRGVDVNATSAWRCRCTGGGVP